MPAQVFAGDLQTNRIVNVASVRQLSPFRYPGGKTWLAPRVRRWLRNQPSEFIEPFAGGGIISLTVAAEKLASRVTMVELDEQVAAVWKTILTDDDGAWLVDRILNFDLTAESLREELSKPAASTREKAFQTILKNRTYRGGILARGAAPLKYGENGKGIKSRWYPDTLKKRILEIAALRDRVTFIEGDGMKTIRQFAHLADAAFFIDPPYTAAGKKAGRRLYVHSELDHEELFSLMSRAAGDFLMTYDDAAGVREMARSYGFDIELVAMKNTHHAEMNELLIGRSLDWLRN
ncbi:MAG: DNA adenine methylase [Acidobacteriota bacterium]